MEPHVPLCKELLNTLWQQRPTNRDLFLFFFKSILIDILVYIMNYSFVVLHVKIAHCTLNPLLPPICGHLRGSWKGPLRCFGRIIYINAQVSFSQSLSLVCILESYIAQVGSHIDTSWYPKGKCRITILYHAKKIHWPTHSVQRTMGSLGVISSGMFTMAWNNSIL